MLAVPINVWNDSQAEHFEYYQIIILMYSKFSPVIQSAPSVASMVTRFWRIIAAAAQRHELRSIHGESTVKYKLNVCVAVAVGACGGYWVLCANDIWVICSRQTYDFSCRKRNDSQFKQIEKSFINGIANWWNTFCSFSQSPHVLLR